MLSVQDYVQRYQNTTIRDAPPPTQILQPHTHTHRAELTCITELNDEIELEEQINTSDTSNAGRSLFLQTWKLRNTYFIFTVCSAEVQIVSVILAIYK